MSGPLDTATEAWGEDMPDWIRTLAIQCGKSSQSKVAALLGRSPAMVSHLLRNKYPIDDLSRIEARVRGVFENRTVQCPAIRGPMAAHVCQDWQAKARTFVAGNPLRRRMHQACNGCPQNRKGTADADP